MLRIAPGEIAALQVSRRDTFAAQEGRSTLAQFQAFLADNHDFGAGHLRNQCLDLVVRVTPCRGNQAWIRIEILVDTDIDDDRRFGRTDKTSELGNGDLNW